MVVNRLASVLAFKSSRYFSAEDLRERCTVHFTPYAPDGMAIGGRLMRDRPQPDVTMEYSDWAMSTRRQRRLAAALTSLLAGLFDIRDPARSREHSVSSVPAA